MNKPAVNGNANAGASGFGRNAVNKPATSSNANADVTGFFARMGNSTRPPPQAFGSNNFQTPQTHSSGRSNFQPTPQTFSTTNLLQSTPSSSNSTNDINSFFSQMDDNSRAPAPRPGVSHSPGHGHVHGQGLPPNPFNPPTGPAAMRGSTTYTPGSVQFRPSPLGPNAANVQRVNGQI